MGNNEIDDDVMPVFLINGFLEAGKTQFLEFTMDQEYFQTEGKTLLIVCEEGDTEYDEKKLKEESDSCGIMWMSFAKLTPAVSERTGSDLSPGARAHGVERHVEPGRAEAAGRLDDLPADHHH
ncbi:MAG: hypothetical protein ACLVAV_14085 [Clostridium sp.]